MRHASEALASYTGGAHDLLVPTHQDYPWLRDQRAQEEREAAAAGRRPWDPVGRPHPTDEPTAFRRALMPALGFVLALVLIVVVAQRAGLFDETAPPVGLGGLAAAVDSPAPAATEAPAPAVSAETVVTRPAIRSLHSRISGPGTLEVWGRSAAPDGTTIRLRIAAPGLGSHRLPAVPIAEGRFYTRERVPSRFRGTRFMVRARAESVR